MVKPVRRSADEVIEAIKDSGGIKVMIAQRLGVNRMTVDQYLKRYPTAQHAYEAEVSTVGDLAESVIIKALKDKDVDTARWYARFKLRDRGYAERQELTGANGGPMELQVVERVVTRRDADSRTEPEAG